MELFLIRHAESTNNIRKNESDRVADPELTQRGLLQRDHLMNFFKKGLHLTNTERESGGKVLDHLYCSAMQRALQTTQPIAQSIELKPEVWVEIHEVGGLYDVNSVDGSKFFCSGLKREEINSGFPGYILPPEVTDQGWWNRDAETMRDAHLRVKQVIQQLTERATEKARIGLVTHGAFMSLFFSILFKLHPSKKMMFQHYNSSISRISFEKKDRIIIQYLNSFEYLPKSLRIPRPGFDI
ncbi:histidine phosphatase family protein [bacterium]|nr:histidine phosphatase family protein [Deltaproteobacteria bacterium]MDB3917865.1 histidine phosphatase family protein [bacterium]